MSKFDKLDKSKIMERLNVLDSGTSDKLLTIPIDEISPNPFQPRKKFNETQIRELANSIKKDGLLQPIIVKKNIDVSKENKYVLIAGERRLRACKLLKQSSIKAIIQGNNTVDLKVLALIENTQRENLSSIEEATTMKELMEIKNLSKKELSELVSKSYDHTISLLSLAELPDEIRDDLLANIDIKISIQTLQSLSRLSNIEDAKNLYFKIKEDKLNKKESLRLISDFKKQKENQANANNGNNGNKKEQSSLPRSVDCIISKDEFFVRLNLKMPIERKSDIDKMLGYLSTEFGIKPH